ncbi:MULTISPECIES: hypothetical protein [Bradyrhizobium]|uniref:hypothetical protein n=1 Tax=Bradyrhizobium pachyrhizi TaxID=280333 RepID=UPI002AA548CE
MVDEVVGKVALAIRNVPPLPRPSRSEDDLVVAFDELIDQLGRIIIRLALSVLKTHPAKHVSRKWGSEAAISAAQKFAALAAHPYASFDSLPNPADCSLGWLLR